MSAFPRIEVAKPHWGDRASCSSEQAPAPLAVNDAATEEQAPEASPVKAERDADLRARTQEPNDELIEEPPELPLVDLLHAVPTVVATSSAIRDEMKQLRRLVDGDLESFSGPVTIKLGPEVRFVTR